MAYENLIPQKVRGIPEYKAMLANLFPRGPIWDSKGSVFMALLESVAVELDRFEQKTVDVLKAAVPGLSTIAEFLPDWENAILSPTEKPSASETEAQRQARVHMKWTGAHGDPTNAFFIAYALGLGMTITIGTGTVARFGTARFGERFATDGGPNTWTISGATGPNAAVFKEFVEVKKPAHTRVYYI